MLSAIAPWTKLRIVFKPARTLKVLSKLKSQIPLLMKSKVVYRVNCLNCSEFYIGKTVRNLGTRLKEHSSNEYSALYKHQLSKSHSIDFNNPSVVASDHGRQKPLKRGGDLSRQVWHNKCLWYKND